MSSTVLDTWGLNDRCRSILHYSVVTPTFTLQLKDSSHVTRDTNLSKYRLSGLARLSECYYMER